MKIWAFELGELPFLPPASPPPPHDSPCRRTDAPRCKANTDVDSEQHIRIRIRIRIEILFVCSITPLLSNQIRYINVGDGLSDLGDLTDLSSYRSRPDPTDLQLSLCQRF